MDTYDKFKADDISDRHKIRKQDQFFKWLLGEKVEFPFFKNLPEVKMPKKYGRE